MKKLIFISALVCAFISSCHPSKTSTAEIEVNDTLVVDSIPVDTVALDSTICIL